MSAQKSSKLDLLVRVRYQNPLPAPPCPPKLLNIPTNPDRYSKIEYTWDYANEIPFPMVVDAEMGMGLDLSRYECLWQDNGDPLELAPDPENLLPVDPKDEFLLENSTVQLGASTSNSQAISNAPAPQFTWLRRSEYVATKDGPGKAQALVIEDDEEEIIIDISREAQIIDVESTFRSNSNISNIRHPTNPKRKAVEVFDILPDAETFPNTYDIFKFSERPGDKNHGNDDIRLESALLRPIISGDGDSFLAYYLPRDEEKVKLMKEQRNFGLEMNIQSEIQSVPFDFIRDYDSAPQRIDQGTELVFFFDDGSLPHHVDALGSKLSFRRSKGAYYKNIDRRLLLKRKRLAHNETLDYPDKWDTVNLSYREMDDFERMEREGELSEIVDPYYREEGDDDDHMDAQESVPNGDH